MHAAAPHTPSASEVDGTHRRPLTAVRVERRDYETRAMAFDVARWLARTMGVHQADDLFDMLETGVELISLLRYITSEPITFHANALPGTFQARENVSQFLAFAIVRLGIDHSRMFETSDVVNRRSLRDVCKGLLEVARVALIRHPAMVPPRIVELEIADAAAGHGPMSPEWNEHRPVAVNELEVAIGSGEQVWISSAIKKASELGLDPALIARARERLQQLRGETLSARLSTAGAAMPAPAARDPLLSPAGGVPASAPAPA
jgi:hypothetical protein